MEPQPIPDEQWRRAQDIFHTAVGLPAGERAAMVEAACGADPQLRREVESLLQADCSEEVAMLSSIGSEAEALLGDCRILGARLGDYRVLREIGRGGMGTVYLAERDDQQYRKLVAIKVVTRGMDTDNVLDRFRHERQILANLDHPYIARLIDGGSTAEGRPFFVMECVQGQRIDDYCCSKTLDIPARLRLFLRVCEAVSEAHRNLIVHRDLKPGNILVTPDGVPKLLDFGVAKLLDPVLKSGSPATALSQGPLTPEYASPEQVRGLPATTAIDVYSLGAVLYELLTGVVAQRIGPRTPAEVDRVVCQTQISRPSTAGKQTLRRQLAGDLDNIILMAMRKEKDRRYQSVDQMADDIRRHLSGLAVMARHDSLWYRFWKFVRRHRLSIAALCLVAGSLIAGVMLAQSQARQATAARLAAEAQRQAADRERARAEAEALEAQKEKERSEKRLTQMVELADRSLHDVHSAIERLPGSTEARRQIVASTLQFLEDLSRDAGQDDRLRYVLSVAYSKVADTQGYPMMANLGDRAGALANYGKATQWITPLLLKDPMNPQYLLQSVRVRLRTGVTLDWEGQRNRAIQIFRDALPGAGKLARLNPRDSDSRVQEASLYAALSNAYRPVDIVQSVACSRKQVQLLLAVSKDFPENRDLKLELAGAYSQLGQSLHSSAGGGLGEPVEPYTRSIALREAAVENNPADTVARRGLMISYANLGAILYSPLVPSLGDIAAAARYYGKAVSIARELAAADPQNRLAQYDLANALLRYGMVETAPGEREASLANLQTAEGILGKLLVMDPKSRTTAEHLSMAAEYVGHRLRDMDRLPEAAAAYRRSLELAERSLAENSKDAPLIDQAVADEGALALVLAMQGDRGAPEMSLKAIDRAKRLMLEIDRNRGRNSLASAYGTLGRVHQALGNCAAARQAAEAAMAVWKEIEALRGRAATAPQRATAEAVLQSCDDAAR